MIISKYEKWNIKTDYENQRKPNYNLYYICLMIAIIKLLK